MVATIHSCAVLGVDAIGITIEVDLSNGLPGFHLVGLGAGAVKEGAVRVKAALKHAGFHVPPRKIVVNLAPADVRKEGAAFDLPIALGMLAAHGELEAAQFARTLVMGELALDGELRAVWGGLPAALHARDNGYTAIILPKACAAEAASTGLDVFGARSLGEVVAHLRGEQLLTPEPASVSGPTVSEWDLQELKGLEEAKLALEIAAAGGHNMLLVGPPGGGKSMLAQRMPSILPPLSEREALETSVVYSAAGQLRGVSLLNERPFRSPHHTLSLAGLVGGGQLPRPGEVSLAHHGVLFLDELAEYPRHLLETLRQPIEERSITITRARRSYRFPCAFTLLAAMNPCPCGYFGSDVRSCVCDLSTVKRYRARLSGPLLDRIDLHVHVGHLAFDDLLDERRGESSRVVRARVIAARARQAARFAGLPLHTNAQMGAREVAQFCAITLPDRIGLRTLLEKRAMSPRAIHRVLKIGRTLADLQGVDNITLTHLRAAVAFRLLDEEVN